MKLDLTEFTYSLPPDRIATYPLPQRDASKLLVYKSGKIKHELFPSVKEHLKPGNLLVFNNTKVIPARLLFTKDSGAVIEIFLLEPVEPSPVVAVAMQATESATWRCTIGNLKKWKDDAVLSKSTDQLEMRATLIDRERGLVSLSWTSGLTFAESVSLLGDVPLPPYLKRAAEESDRRRYQTVYSRHEGAVAAPTAGLHFTTQVLDSLAAKGIATDYLTLHVSAGTFQPIKTSSVKDHVMHAEQVTVTKDNLDNLLNHPQVVAVGTTSMRTLESLYWYGVKLMRDPNAAFAIGQSDPYVSREHLPSTTDALQAVRNQMSRLGTDSLTGETSIYILPGYTFRICRGLITNFHQPGSTLIVLVAAFIGPDWRKVYAEAMDNDYRFLSYGDSSLLLPFEVTT